MCDVVTTKPANKHHSATVQVQIARGAGAGVVVVQGVVVVVPGVVVGELVPSLPTLADNITRPGSIKFELKKKQT